mmetsp:Transcript_4284/g.10729  ORF Transcript_4284/g.10729 Transcript_4284/m.10729 type:complete len:246 (-) Transcript_4284:2952-3689(-)
MRAVTFSTSAACRARMRSRAPLMVLESTREAWFRANQARRRTPRAKAWMQAALRNLARAAASRSSSTKRRIWSSSDRDAFRLLQRHCTRIANKLISCSFFRRSRANSNSRSFSRSSSSARRSALLFRIHQRAMRQRCAHSITNEASSLTWAMPCCRFQASSINRRRIPSRQIMPRARAWINKAASNRFFLKARARRFSRSLFATKFLDCLPFHNAANLSAAAALNCSSLTASCIFHNLIFSICVR